MDDRELGMDVPIPRRDFLDGLAMTIAGAAFAGGLSAEPARAAGAYPPALGGLRGQLDANYAVMHRVRDGTFWNDPPPAHDTGERYDLVVVGGGISGLASAYFYRKERPGARILVIDIHDDFGGHAKRNEFTVDGKELLSYGGTQSIEDPGEYSVVAMGLLRDLGIDVRKFERFYDRKRYARLGTGVFFDKQTFGRDHFASGMGKRPWPAFLADAPLSDAAKRDIARIYTERVDYLPHLTKDEKRAKLAKTSYADFLTKIAGVTPEALPFFQSRTNDNWALQIDAVGALDMFETGDDYGNDFPGFQGMDLGSGLGKWSESDGEPYIYHFPDGNASIARLLVRKLIPGSMPGTTMEDIVLARCNYDALDRRGEPVRIRFSSTAVRAAHVDPSDHAKGVEISYVRGGRLERVRAGACVMACWNSVTSYIVPEIPEAQRTALKYGDKAPLVYAHVAIRNWRSFERLSSWQVIAPGSYWPYVALDFPVDIDGYRSSRDPEEPIVLFVLRTPCAPGGGRSAREQYRAGRAELFATSFATLERALRDELARMLGPAGFDPGRDIAGITINRWSHGYAYQYTSLWDPQWAPNASPCEIGRKTYGRIAIANSDAQAYAYTDAAINQAHRAVHTLL